MLTSLDFLNPGKQWPPPEEAERLKLYEQNKDLFKGRHERVFKNWVKLLREDEKAILELILNWNKRLSLLWADLLLGEPPQITAGDPDSKEQLALKNLMGDEFFNVSYEVAIDVSRFGVGLLKVRHDGSKSIIEGQPPTYWFPVVNPANLKEITHQVLAWVVEEIVPGVVGNKKQKVLYCEIHEKGKITYRKYKCTGDKLGSLMEPEKIQATNIKDMLIIPVNNIVTTDTIIGMDDYSDLDAIIQELETRLAQIAKILDKHSDPNMYGPESALTVDPVTGETKFIAGGKFFPVDDQEKPPGYIVWEGQLEAAFKEIDVLMGQLFMLSETSAACFGELKSGLAESGSALKRLMMAPLAKVNRIRMRFDPAMKKALRIASELEVAQSTTGAMRLENINIGWQDGLPDDPVESTQVEVQRFGAGLSSLESSVKRLYGLTGKQLQEELDKIEAEKPEPPEVVMPGEDEE